MAMESEILDTDGNDAGEIELNNVQESQNLDKPTTRKLQSWLAGYEEYCEDWEPPRIFNRWVGLLTLATVTQRRVWLVDANTQIWPNLFVVLVAPSGVGKTSAMREAIPFIEAGLGSRHISPSKITAAQFAKRFGQAVKTDSVMGIYTPYLVWAEEFPSFLGNDAYKSGMIADLTTLYDCPERWVKETKHQGIDDVVNPYLCLGAGSVPQSLFDVLPSGSVTLGFTSRLMFIYSTYNSKRVVEKPWNQKHIKLRELLLNDIRVIASLHGSAIFSDIARTLWTDYYMHRPQAEAEFVDPRLQGYAARKPFYVKKIAILLSISESDRLVVEADHVERAFEMLQEIDESLRRVYEDIAPSTVIQAYAKIVRKLRVAPKHTMSHSELQKAFCYILGKKEFTEAIEALMEMGLIEAEHVQGLAGSVRFTRYYKLTPGGLNWSK